MTKYRMYHLMQINSGTFPTGGFSQSFGLETYVEDGIVCDANTFQSFLFTYLDACVGKCEGPIICQAFQIVKEHTVDIKELKELNTLSNASKVTKESREAGIRMGKAFFRIFKEMIDAKEFNDIIKALGEHISYPVVYGIACRLMGLDMEDAVRGYIFSTANTLVQSAIKLIPLGNTEAQSILYKAGEKMEYALKLSLETSIDEITNFCPGLDIAGIKHETLETRLYMS